MAIASTDASNIVEIGENVTVTGKINGRNNRVIIGDSTHPSTLNISISGDNNQVVIDKPFYIKGLQVKCGNHVKAYNAELKISENVSIEAEGIFFLYNSGNICHIGKDCLISNNLTIRCGESPHLIFDKTTGEYLDVTDGVFIGDHVWIGEKVYITKKTTIPSESVVAACSVVTKRFDEPHSVLAGNPAKVVKRNIQWIRNHSHLEPGSIYKAKHDEHKSQFPRK